MAAATTVDADVERAVRRFLFAESEAIDERRFEEWLGMMTDDVTYRVPVRLTREHGAEDEFGDVAHFEDNRYRIERRIDRLTNEYAWSENPPTRTRHYVSNIRVRPGEGPEEYDVRSNLMYAETRGDEEPVLLTGERRDVLRRTGDGLRLAGRTVRLDQTRLPVPKLSLFL